MHIPAAMALYCLYYKTQSVIYKAHTFLFKQHVEIKQVQVHKLV